MRVNNSFVFNQFKGNGLGLENGVACHQAQIVCVCVTVCVHVSQRQKDKEGEFNGVSQGEAPLFPLIKHAGSALAP